jgi:hypothetical protein
VIKAVYRNGSMLPNVKDGEQWLGNSDNYQLSNHAGWFRSALNLISDTSFKRKVKAFESEIESGRETKKVTGLWHTFAGTIVFKSLGSLRLLAGSVLNISALKKINISSKEVTVIKSAKIYLGSDSNDVIDLLIQLIDKVKELDKAVGEHVHKSTVPGSPTSNALNPDETPLVGFKADFNSIEKPLKDIKYTPTD